MINLTITVDNISDVLLVFDRVQILRYIGTGIPSSTVDVLDYTTISGIDQISNRTDVSDVLLASNYTQYYFTDPDGTADSWFTSRYYNTSTDSASGWADPIQGDSGDLYYNPLYPVEVSYGTADQRIIDRIRILTGDPIGLSREYGSEAESSIHSDGKTYQFEEFGWPSSINMYGKQYNEKSNPSVNGYEYLRFNEAIDTTVTTVSGVEYSVDIWYYTFRKSDRQIMDVYDNTYPPTPLTTINCTSDIYMLQASYDILISETNEAINEDGASIKDEGSSYSPEPGLKTRSDMLSKLRKRLDDAIKSVSLLGITGVRLD